MHKSGQLESPAMKPLRSRLEVVDYDVRWPATFAELSEPIWNAALVRTTILEGTVLVMVYPLIAAIANYLIFKERITRRVGDGREIL